MISRIFGGSGGTISGMDAVRRLSALAAALSILVLVLSACTPEAPKSGVVATVNGQAITMKHLELKYDFIHLNWNADQNPTVSMLREDYGQILGDMIIQVLVEQELDRRGKAVTSEELQRAEDEIRADYPDGDFEQVLVEEYIDLRAWRKELGARLAVEKFFREILRPDISLDYQEAEAYYREHLADFYLPARVRFWLIRGPVREQVESAVEQYRKGGAPETLQDKFNRLTVRELKVREDRLTMDLATALKGLAPGQAGPVLSDATGFYGLIFMDKQEARVLEASRAYPVVEKILVERKLRQAFEEWLARAASTAQIRISPHLKISPALPTQAEEPESANGSAQ